MIPVLIVVVVYKLKLVLYRIELINSRQRNRVGGTENVRTTKPNLNFYIYDVVGSGML